MEFQFPSKFIKKLVGENSESLLKDSAPTSIVEGE